VSSICFYRWVGIVNERQQWREKVSSWIKLEEQMPKIGERVLIWTCQALEAVMYDKGKFNRFGADIDYATHWMPLPSKPEGDRK